MAALRTPVIVEHADGPIIVLSIDTLATGDTVKYDAPIESWCVINKTTDNAVTATYSTSTKLFTITGAGSPNIDMWIVGPY